MRVGYFTYVMFLFSHLFFSPQEEMRSHRGEIGSVLQMFSFVFTVKLAALC